LPKDSRKNKLSVFVAKRQAQSDDCSKLRVVYFRAIPKQRND
jgi:hypothetical protein